MCKGGGSEETCTKEVAKALKTQCVTLNTKEKQHKIGLIALGFENDSNNNRSCECTDGWRTLEIICVVWIAICASYYFYQVYCSWRAKRGPRNGIEMEASAPNPPPNYKQLQP